MNLVLIGAMGAGKTTVGKILAESLHRKFIDTDEIIKERFGYISKIFEIMGRENFRMCEKIVVEAESTRKNAVIATGGGVVLIPENVARLKEGGTLIYLRASALTLYDRLKDSTDRPLLAGDKRKKIEEILSERKELYESAADIVVDTDKYTAKEVAGYIVELLKGEGICEKY